MNCRDCGFPIESDDHIYNVSCDISNDSYETLMVEVRQAQQDYERYGLRRASTDKMVEIAIDALALRRFQQSVSAQPGRHRTLTDELLNWHRD